MLTSAFILRAGTNVLKAAFFWTAAWRLGAWTWAVVKPEGFRRAERVLGALGLGAGVLGLAALALGLCGFLRGDWMVGTMSVLALAALPDAYVAARDADWRALRARLRAQVGAETAVPLAFLGLAGLYQFLVALGPAVYYDSLVYHLAFPQQYLAKGVILPAPMNVFAGFPQGVEMLYAWVLPLSPLGTAAQLLHFSLGLLTTAVIVCVGRLMGRTSAGLWAAAWFFSNPAVMLESGHALVELGWAFYVALTLLALAVYDLRRDERVLFLAGAFAGLALGTKYQAVLLLPAVAGWMIHRFGRRAALRPAGVVCATAVALAAPWGLRNIFFYHNPVFPFLGGGLFPEPVFLNVGEVISSAHGRDLAHLFSRAGELRSLLLHPWRYSMPAQGEAENVLSPALTALLLLLLFVRKNDHVRRLGLFAILLWVPMNLLSDVGRFSIPALVPLGLAATLTLDELPAAWGGVWRAAMAAFFVMSLLYVHSTLDGLIWTTLSGEIPEKTFLGHWRPGYFAPPFPAFDWANENLAPDAKILLVGEPRSFFLRRDFETSSPYALQPLFVFANASSSGDDLYKRLKAAGFTHIIMNYAAQGAGRQVMKMSSAGLASLREFWSRDLSVAFIDGGKVQPDIRLSIVYRILSEEAAARPHRPTEVPFGVAPKP